jgi:hypothetical protein
MFVLLRVPQEDKIAGGRRKGSDKSTPKRKANKKKIEKMAFFKIPYSRLKEDFLITANCSKTITVQL